MTENFKISYSKKRIFLKHDWTISRGSYSFKDNVFLSLEKEGIIGCGEAAPNERYGESAESVISFLQETEDYLATCDPWRYEQVISAIHNFKADNSSAKACIDLALLDWIGKKLKVPLHRLWGLDPNTLPLTSFTIGLDRPEIIQQKVAEAQEYPILKVKLGKATDREIITTIRRMTDKVIRVDANEGWIDRNEALKKIKWLSELNVEFVEQPMPAGQSDDMLWLKQRSPLPLFADESVKTSKDVPQIASLYDGINIKIDKSGGLLEALKMIHIARALGMKVMLGCMVSSSLSITAAAQLAPLADFLDLDGNLLIANDPFQGVIVSEGKLSLPNKPGIGAKLMIEKEA